MALFCTYVEHNFTSFKIYALHRDIKKRKKKCSSKTNRCSSPCGAFIICPIANAYLVTATDPIFYRDSVPDQFDRKIIITKF